MKAVFILAILCFIAYTKAAVIECEYSNLSHWITIGYVIQCKVQNMVNILTKDSAFIDSAYPSTRQKVEAFSASGKQIHFFPRHLEKFFPNLTGIGIENCGLKEINKEDLKPFTKLRSIGFHKNDIQVVEKDLFLYNPLLEFVGFGNNKISIIDPNVFDNLQKLSSLWLRSNDCIDKFSHKNDTAIKSLIDEIKSNETCSDPQFSAIDLDILSLETQNFDPESFLEKFGQLKSRIESSNLSSSLASSFKMRLDDIFKLNESKLLHSWLLKQTAKNSEAENRLASLEASIKQTEAKLETELMDIKARMSALEAMTQKILEKVENLTRT